MNSAKRLLVLALALVTPGVLPVASGQVAGTNVNMVAGTKWPTGDPYLQRQNEPSLGVSTRNPLHLFAGSNDYRTVDIPFPPDAGMENGDSWLGTFKSIDGGESWITNLIPGYPQDQSPAGLASPLKAYPAATDPTVRAGTHGLFYYSGLVFDRDPLPHSAVFVAVYQDQNNHGNGDPIKYIRTTIIDNASAGEFLDKPGMAVDIPRADPDGNAVCSIGGTTIHTGKVYVAYTEFLGNQTLSRINIANSLDCGQTWSHPVNLAASIRLSQSPQIGIDPATGTIYVVWRELASDTQPDAIVYTKSTDFGKTYAVPAAIYTFAPGQPFDQPNSAASFRSLSLPTIAVDSSGRVFVAWSQRGLGPNGDARVVVSTLAPNSSTWTAPYVADPTATGRGHQFLPAFSYAYGKLMLIFYDQREDSTSGVMRCVTSGKPCTAADFVEFRIPQGDLAAGHPDKVFNTFIQDVGVARRHTIDVRGAMVDPLQFSPGAPTPLPFPSVRISQYKFGTRPGSRVIEQLQYNPPNFPMFVKGTRPFIGDFVDVGGLAFVVDASGNWVYNTNASNAPVFHAVWTDNRDVRPPPVVCSGGVCKQDWTAYTPVASTGGPSLFDNTQARPVCVPNVTGSKNQNVYTSRITQGLVVGFKENAKNLVSSAGNPLQRAFSVFVQNNTAHIAYYRLVINAPSSVTASFTQFGTPVLTLDVAVPGRSSASRSVFISSLVSKPLVSVSVTQISAVGGPVLPGGLNANAIINPDITNPDIINPDIINPDITNPDITNPDITNPDIVSAEVYNPIVTNPDITNPDITNPDITNPDIINPGITNPDIINPDINSMVVINPDIVNPDITNPDIINPDIINPDIINPDITNLPTGGATDLSWRVTNKGNTSSSYNAKLFLKEAAFCCPAGCPGGSNCPASCLKCQLIVHRTYTTPVANACQLTVETRNIPVTNILNPTFSNKTNASTVDISPDPTNATVSLGPGESSRVTLRVFGLPANKVPYNPVTPFGLANGADTGQTTPAGSLLLTTVDLPVVLTGVPYSAILTSAGGTGPTRKWSIFSGSLPPGLTLSPAGVISGTTTATGSFAVKFQVQDSPVSPSVPQIDRSLLTLQVNRVSIGGVAAYNTTPGNTVLRGGQSATVAVTVTNAGGAALNALSVPVLGDQGTGAATAANCVPSSSPISTIAGNSSVVVVWLCPVNGNGNLSFAARVHGQFVNGSTTVTVDVPAVFSNTVLVDSTPPFLSVSATANGVPYVAGTWTNKNVSVTFACADKPPGSAAGTPVSGVAAGSPTGSTILTTETAGTSVTGNCADIAGNAAPPLVFGPVRIDKTKPVIAITVPASGVTYALKSVVKAVFTCTDPASGIASCKSPSMVNGYLDTSTTGVKTFTVTALDIAGNTATLSLSYIVQ